MINGKLARSYVIGCHARFYNGRKWLQQLRRYVLKTIVFFISWKHHRVFLRNTSMTHSSVNQYSKPWFCEILQDCRSHAALQVSHLSFIDNFSSLISIYRAIFWFYRAMYLIYHLCQWLLLLVKIMMSRVAGQLCTLSIPPAVAVGENLNWYVSYLWES